MYMTIAETADYLQISPDIIEKLILNQKIRALHDGEQYLIYKNQFDSHLEQMERYKDMLAEWLAEPIPEDWDAKDED